jgi:Protein of unknown function (DUF2934)
MAGRGPRKPRNTTSAGGNAKAANKGTTPTTPEVMPVGQPSRNVEAQPGEFQKAQQKMEEEIRFRAYQLFEERGRHDGHHHEDWVRAEIEIRAKYQRAKSA